MDGLVNKAVIIALLGSFAGSPAFANPPLCKDLPPNTTHPHVRNPPCIVTCEGPGCERLAEELKKAQADLEGALDLWRNAQSQELGL
jgi:hypothetical protein